jgi:hypothetical protein
MFKFKKYDHLDLTVFIGKSEVTFNDWMDILSSYRQAGPTRYELYDLREVTNTLEDHHIRAIAEASVPFTELRPPGSKTALVVSKPIHRWLSRLYIIMGDVVNLTWETREFKNIEQAADWLGTDVSEIEEIEMN